MTPIPAPPVVQPETEPEHHPTPNKNCDGLRKALGIAQGHVRDWREANEFATFGNRAQNQRYIDALAKVVQQAERTLADCLGNSP
jgi:hypothetical protein